MNAQTVTGNFGSVKDVEWPVAVIGKEICDIDQSRNRPQANGFQPVLHPLRAGPVFYTLDHAAKKDRTLPQRIFVNAHSDGAGKFTFYRGDLLRL